MSESSAKPRLHFIDMMKGIAIITIVFYHILLPSTAETIVEKVAGSFMIMFFFLSGYFYEPGKKSYQENLAEKAKELLCPFFQYSLILWTIGTIYHIFIDKMSFLEALCCLRNFYGGCIWNRVIEDWLGWDYHHLGSRYMFLADFWFLLALFFAFVLFLAFADWALKSHRRTWLIMGILLAVEMLLLAFEVDLPYNIQDTPYFALLLLIGVYARVVDLFGLPEKRLPKVPDWAFGVLLLAVEIAISAVSDENAINLFRGIFGSNQVLSMLIVTVRAFLLMWGVGIIARRIEFSGMRIREICYIGENSLFIFMFHVAFVYFISVFAGFPLSSDYKDTMPTVRDQVRSAILAAISIVLSLGTGRLCKKIEATGKNRHTN